MGLAQKLDRDRHKLLFVCPDIQYSGWFCARVRSARNLDVGYVRNVDCLNLFDSPLVSAGTGDDQVQALLMG